jgi:hypothetical protein
MPDSVVPVVGFRRWAFPRPTDLVGLGIPENTLVTRRHPWPVGKDGAIPMRALCQRRFTPHREHYSHCEDSLSPVGSCECGIYAHHEILRGKHYRAMEFGSGSVFGAAIGWGRVYFDEEWWRAQWALPIAFCDPRDTESHCSEPWLEKACDWLEAISERYNVPILPFMELEKYALRFGAVWEVPPLTDEEEEAMK